MTVKIYIDDFRGREIGETSFYTQKHKGTHESHTQIIYEEFLI